MDAFVTVNEVVVLSGRSFTEPEIERLDVLIPLVSDALRQEAVKVGKDLDAMIAADASYGSVVKLVTVDVVIRAMRQDMTSDPLTQFSKSAMGYSVSGTYSIPGGGIAAAIMKNDLKRLGLKRQRIGGIELYHGSPYQGDNGYPDQ
jgi:hypothetical protein